jgi:penicillin-binding protein 1C
LGAIPANEALARSLNIPAVRSLRRYGVERFAGLLRGLGVTTLFRRDEDYGLPLILGGAEVTLWEITGLYAGLARTSGGGLFFHPYYHHEDGPPSRIPARSRISPGAAWLTLDALVSVNRPGEEAYWQEYAGSRRIAWKTGTSFGSRDAWAVGTRPDRTVGVWIGNAGGEGRAELLSVTTSAPVLFELFSALDAIGSDSVEWFPRPPELAVLETCAFSGFPAGADCTAVKNTFVPGGAPQAAPCSYCRTVALNETGDRLVTAASANRVRLEKRFVLPPAEEWYYRTWNLDYRSLPPFDTGSGDLASIALFNPEENGAVYVPKELDGKEGRIVFQAASRGGGGIIYWHLDNAYLGRTEIFHEMEARPPPGRHTLTLVDAAGGVITRRFEVLNQP